MLSILYPDIKSKEEMIEDINDTLGYIFIIICKKRLKVKTCGQVKQ